MVGSEEGYDPDAYYYYDDDGGWDDGLSNPRSNRGGVVVLRHPHFFTAKFPSKLLPASLSV